MARLRGSSKKSKSMGTFTTGRLNRAGQKNLRVSPLALKYSGLRNGSS